MKYLIPLFYLKITLENLLQGRRIKITDLARLIILISCHKQFLTLLRSLWVKMAVDLCRSFLIAHQSCRYGQRIQLSSRDKTKPVFSWRLNFLWFWLIIVVLCLPFDFHWLQSTVTNQEWSSYILCLSFPSHLHAHLFLLFKIKMQNTVLFVTMLCSLGQFF